MNTINSVSKTTVESQAVNLTDFQVALQHTAATPSNTPITHADLFGDAPMFFDHLYPSRFAATTKVVEDAQ